MKRSSGILMPMSSLPSNYGIGTMGKAAFSFVDFLAASGQRYWQLLPMGPTGCGDSPYSSFSSFAGNPYFIDLDLLIKDGLLSPKDVKNIDWGDNAEEVDYGKIYKNRFKVLYKAYEKGRTLFAEELSRFCAENSAWLENYALFTAIKEKFGGKCWLDWEDEKIRKHDLSAVEEYKNELADRVEFYEFVQFLFFNQWEKLKKYAAEKEVYFIGDVPIYAALDSADVWSEPRFFNLDEDNVPTEVAGVPPDAFSEDGQLWGNPLYNWEEMRKDGYGWWIRRIGGAERLFDVIRIDHFRGFESFWAIPYGDKDAKNGKWEKGPGVPFVKMLAAWFSGLEFIAEDLGIIGDDVRNLVKESGFPGMKVLEFAFNSESYSTYLPHSCGKDSVCYIGTHDNETVSGWLENSKKADIAFAKKYMKITEDEGWQFGFIRTGMQTNSTLFVVQMQDVLSLPPNTRTNIPGKAFGNWKWRMKKGAATAALSKRLYSYTKTYQRLSVSDIPED